MLFRSHVLQVAEADFSRVVKVHREQAEAWKAREGFALTFMPFITRAISVALGKFPKLNATYTPEGLRLNKRINIGIAVDLNFDGLMVPVLKDVPNKSLPQIAREIMKFKDNGLLYRGSKPVMWSVVEKTALAEAEIEYQDYQSDMVWVKFPVTAGALAGKASVVIWTTTPWTLPGNRAISYSSKISYGLYRVTEAPDNNWAFPGAKFILADKLAPDVFKAAKVGGKTFAEYSVAAVDQIVGADVRIEKSRDPQYQDKHVPRSFWEPGKKAVRVIDEGAAHRAELDAALPPISNGADYSSRD